VLHNRHIVDFLQRVSFPGGVQSATLGTKAQDADSRSLDLFHGQRRLDTRRNHVTVTTTALKDASATAAVRRTY
jgi:hypothetical protein